MLSLFILTLIGAATVAALSLFGWLVYKVNSSFWPILGNILAVILLGSAALFIILYVLTFIGAIVVALAGVIF
jgi:hypothetical protein